MREHGHRPHDLLQVDGLDEYVHSVAPQWVLPALHGTAWVVVLPGGSPADCLTVGVRGKRRGERYALSAPRHCVVDAITPEDIAGVRAWPTRNIPALQAFREVRAPLNQLGVPWGPTGSVGYELATGLAAVTACSDLNLILRVPMIDQTMVRRLVALWDCCLADLGATVDCQVETCLDTRPITEFVSGAIRGESILYQ